YASEAAFNRGLASYIEFYNTQRPHRTLKNQTPCQVEELFMSDNQ
ncbi:integrase core domain-containing protein, partial [Lactococcus sp. UBA7220]